MPPFPCPHSVSYRLWLDTIGQRPSAHMASKHVRKAQCWRMAVEWALEVYGGLNEHSHKRCLLKNLEKKVDPGVAGRPCKFSPPIMQKMAVLTHSV
eukprot:1490752-Amphidinium_carterae.1